MRKSWQDHDFKPRYFQATKQNLNIRVPYFHCYKIHNIYHRPRHRQRVETGFIAYAAVVLAVKVLRINRLEGAKHFIAPF